MILFFASDLIWATRIKGTADALGLACRPVRTPEMLEARLADSPVRSLIVDLDTPEVAIDLIRRVRAAETGMTPGARLRVVAFGPHMAKEALKEAEAAGADHVLPRGAFDRDLVGILKALAPNEGPQ